VLMAGSLFGPFASTDQESWSAVYVCNDFFKIYMLSGCRHNADFRALEDPANA